MAFSLATVGSGDNVLEQLLQAQLREIGATVTILQLELSTFLAVAQSPERDFDAMVTGIPGDLSLGHVAAMFAGDRPGPLAYPGHRDPELDRALAAATQATTRDAISRRREAELPTNCRLSATRFRSSASARSFLTIFVLFLSVLSTCSIT